LHRRDKPFRKSRSPRRDTVILSHAYEDNQFTRWLALQLARNGYQVWCDPTELLGGESFWHDIETLIRTRCIKFIYVLSRNSNQGQGRGFWKELDLADAQSKVNKMPDFIIPVAVDDLRSDDYNIFLHTRHAEKFHPNWSDGLATLLKKLEKHKVPPGISDAARHGSHPKSMASVSVDHRIRAAVADVCGEGGSQPAFHQRVSWEGTNRPSAEGYPGTHEA
jgi:hypothetical protein